MTTVPESIASHSRPLCTANAVKLAVPLDEKTRRDVELSRNAIRSILSRPVADGRLLVVVGPCSIHDPDAALEYATLLAKAASQHRHELLVVMRVYVEKPRSTVGWKGLVHDPDHALDSPNRGGSSHTPDLNKGVLMSRRIMAKVAKLGLPVATELLNPLLPQFFQDVVSLGVIGARTTESQTHREMASSMPMPMGFKNGTDGGLQVAVDAMKSASRPHTVVGVDEEGCLDYHLSRGNPDTFLILRGGSRGPNFSPSHVQDAAGVLHQALGSPRPVVVDCSHGNSMKDYRNQGQVASCLADQIAAGAPVAGVMLESNIHEGRQDAPEKRDDTPLKYGVSITDGCVGWNETSLILESLAAAVQRRKARNARANSAVTTTDDEKHLMKIDVSEVGIACAY